MVHETFTRRSYGFNSKSNRRSEATTANGESFGLGSSLVTISNIPCFLARRFSLHLFHSSVRGVTLTKSTCWLSLSLFIILVQCMVLSTIVDESSYARCIEHTDCKIGEFCAPSPWNQMINPGACHDCYATEEPREQPCLYIDHADCWDVAEAHCAETDTMPLRCDFLTHNRGSLSGGGVLVLLFSAIVALIPTIADLDQAGDEKEVMDALGIYSQTTHYPKSTRVLLYVSHKARVSFVPLLVVAATSSLLLSDSLNSQNFLLNGMAVGFASNIDDLISFVLISEGERQAVEVMVEDALVASQRRRKGWTRNRIFGIVLAFTLLVSVVWCEELMVMAGNETDMGRRPCSDLLDVAERIPMLVGIVAFIVMTLLDERNDTWGKKIKDVAKGAAALSLIAGISQIGMVLNFGIVM